MVIKVLPCSGCFITSMGVHFPALELDNVIQFSTLSTVSTFLWHSSKLACWLGHFLQYTSGLEVLARSLNTADLNYVTAMLQLCPSFNPLCKVADSFRGEMWQLFGCIFIDRHVTLEFSGKIHKFLQSLASVIISLSYNDY